MSELASADTLVQSVSATDKDSGLNGKITYRLLSSPLQGFYIEPENGERGLTDGKDFLLCSHVNASLTANHRCVCVYVDKRKVKNSPEG